MSKYKIKSKRDNIKDHFNKNSQIFPTSFQPTDNYNQNVPLFNCNFSPLMSSDFSPLVSSRSQSEISRKRYNNHRKLRMPYKKIKIKKDDFNMILLPNFNR